MAISVKLKKDTFLKLVKDTGLTLSQIEREILRWYDVEISAMTLRIYCGRSKHKTQSPHIEKLEILAKYFSDKLGQDFRIQDFYELEVTPFEPYAREGCQ